MAEFAPEMPVKSALVPIGAESVRRCSSVPPMREGAHFGAGLIHPGQPVAREFVGNAQVEAKLRACAQASSHGLSLQYMNLTADRGQSAS